MKQIKQMKGGFTDMMRVHKRWKLLFMTMLCCTAFVVFPSETHAAESMIVDVESQEKSLTGMELSLTKVYLEVGKTTTLNVNFTPEDTTDSKEVTWSSSDANIASVSEGMITAVDYGTAVITAKCGDVTAQCTVVVEKLVSEFPLVDNGVYTIRNVNSGKVLSVRNGSIHEGAWIEQWDYLGANYQKWRAVKKEDGYSFVSIQSGRALDLFENDTNEGADFRQSQYHGSINQRFRLIDRGEERYSMHPVSSNYALDIPGGSIENGTELRQYAHHEGLNQLFTFEFLYVDTEAPVISKIYCKDISHTGYTVVCEVTDDVAMGRVCFPTWTEANGQDELAIDWYNNTMATSVSGNTYSFRVKSSDHNNEYGKYITHVYAYDASGNYVLDASVTVDVPIYLPFTDVEEGSWYYDYVAEIYAKGYMVGGGDGTFKPNGLLTRAEIVTTLYSVNNKPETSYVSQFSDVPDGEWYSNPVSWAYSSHIVSGYADGRFGTADLITREQFALMLYQYAALCGYSTSYEADALDTYSDRDEVSIWADTAMTWAVSNKIVSGKGEGLLDPKGNATRAECATMLSSFMKAFENSVN